MSALKHGFFRRGFMLCDRCVLSGKCDSFVPRGECAVEKKAYDWLFLELTKQYGLEGLADEILIGRVAMYLIRIARAEVYEANVGVSDGSVVWGRYITDLDKALQALLKELALTRAERKKLEKYDVLVDVDRLLNDFTRKSKTESKVARKYIPTELAKKERTERKVVRGHSLWELLLKDWTAEKPKLKAMIRGDQSARI